MQYHEVYTFKLTLITIGNHRENRKPMQIKESGDLFRTPGKQNPRILYNFNISFSFIYSLPVL